MWNKIHEKNFNGEIIYDDWLDEYKDIINSSNIILDIGCGLGNNTKYIKELNKDVISIDYSTYALDIVKKYLNENVLLHDITKKFPYDDNSIDLIIADLSLHYFDCDTTKKVLNELKRILKSNHNMLFRVNTIYDTNYGANEGILIEHNYYNTCGYNKRFFDDIDMHYFFSIFTNLEYKLDYMDRYGNKKVLYKGKVIK